MFPFLKVKSATSFKTYSLIIILDIKDDCLMVEAVNDGTIKPGKGINFPGVKLDLPAITQKDEIDVKLGLSENVDWIAMSFVRSAEDYNLVKGIIVVV